jgi:hypothetical protein
MPEISRETLLLTKINMKNLQQRELQRNCNKLRIAALITEMVSYGITELWQPLGKELRTFYLVIIKVN